MKIWSNLKNLFNILFLMVLLSLTADAFSQGAQVTVSGTVKDQAGSPVIGATVIDAQTQRGTITDMDGNFTLSVSASSTLKVTYVGYRDQVITVTPAKQH